MISRRRRDYSSTTGRVSEVRFKRAAEALGFDVAKSSKGSDIHHHIDFHMTMGNKTWSVDVKGNNLPDEIWCEFKNVHGRDGWMRGRASIIAFEMPEEGGFCVVNRDKLLEWCNENISDVLVDSKDMAYKKKYTRANRKDVVTKIYLDDLRSIESFRVWKYRTA